MRNVAAVSARQLKRGLVVSVESMQVTGKKYIVDLPSIGYEVRFSIADVQQMPPPQFAAFAAEFDKQFSERFSFLRRKWVTALRKTVRDAEEDIRVLGRRTEDTPEAVREMTVMVDAINRSLKAQCDGYATELEELSRTAYLQAFKASFRATKTKPVPPRARVEAQFDLTSPVPPARPLTTVSRFVTLPTARLR